MKGHIRVGLEDFVSGDNGRADLVTNVCVVERIVKVARAVGRQPASAREARVIIGLTNKGGV